MVRFLKEKFGYGLAGFLVGIGVIASVSTVTNGQISEKYLWLGPIGFVLGLLLPKQIIGSMFLWLIKSRSVRGSQEGDIDLEEKQKGWLVNAIYVIGILLLFFLIYIVYLGLKSDVFHK